MPRGVGGGAAAVATGASTHIAKNTVSWDAQDFARVAIGWKLQRGRGDFRLIFNGYSETGYELESTGKLSAIDTDYVADEPVTLGNGAHQTSISQVV